MVVYSGNKNSYLQLKNDPVVAQLIDTYGELPVRAPSKDLFLDLVESIVSQQLSVQAADTIYGRFKKLFPKDVITPDHLVNIEDDLVRRAGLSYSKIEYIKRLSVAVLRKEVNLDTIRNKPDDEVLKELTKIKGIGRWTVEMFLMFSLDRPDVFSVGDAGLRRAIFKLYGIPQNNLRAIEALSFTWKPYRTYASRYLWKSLEQSQ